jgi:hypothetical protein
MNEIQKRKKEIRMKEERKAQKLSARWPNILESS